MKIRIIGTETECDVIRKFFDDKLSASVDYSVSRPYPCRNSTLLRLYIEIYPKEKKK